MNFLKVYCRKWDQLSDKIGESFCWLLLLMAVLTFLIVILRYVFHLSWVWLQEAVIFMHAILFLMGAAYTLLKDAHVKVDVFYTGFSARVRSWVNIWGGVLLLMPTCVFIFFESLPFVADSWMVLETSQDGGGLPGVFLLKTFILIFCLLLFLQGLSLIFKNVLSLNGEGYDEK